jgi:hypothetical protein
MRIRRFSHLFIGILFLLFAIVQFNDPDPWAWILIYCFISIISILSALGKHSKWAAYLVLLVSMIWMVFLFPGLWQWITQEPFDALFGGMDPSRIHLEESREFLGLFIGVISVMYIIFQNQK